MAEIPTEAIGEQKSTFGYSVGDAARLAAVSPSTIRLYERQGLLNLRRTAGGHRYLTEDDLATLRRIRVLRRTRGLSLEATKCELDKASRPCPGAGAEHSSTVHPGPRLRVLRQRQGLGLRDIADRVGLSLSFLSAFERGLSGISVANLQRLIDACGSSLVDVFADEGDERRRLVRPSDRPRLDLENGQIVIEDLAVGPRQIEVQLWTIQPGAGSDGAYSHLGEEAMYLLSGRLEVSLNELSSYSLEPGDCLHFSSNEPHRWRNVEDMPAVILWVNTPPTF